MRWTLSNVRARTLRHRSNLIPDYHYYADELGSIRITQSTVKQPKDSDKGLGQGSNLASTARRIAAKARLGPNVVLLDERWSI